MKHADPSNLATVSPQFAADWVSALRKRVSDDQLKSFLQRARIETYKGQTVQRITLDQIVDLYQITAVETGDEMMGLWSRPVGPRALQHLVTTVLSSNSLTSALYKFSTFWNLILDDYRFELETSSDVVALKLIAVGEQPCQRFGHMLILKLVHGLISWLADFEIPVHSVWFAFEKPSFAEDYSVIFPVKVNFGMDYSRISFEIGNFGQIQSRSQAELKEFLRRAPRDWLFTSSYEHTYTLRARDFLSRSDWKTCHLEDTAYALAITPRTLIRRLKDEGTSFQAIKDGLRRDLAIRDLQSGIKSIDEISFDLGFSSAPNFHRAFRRWTGATPSVYRRA